MGTGHRGRKSLKIKIKRILPLNSKFDVKGEGGTRFHVEYVQHLEAGLCQK